MTFFRGEAANYKKGDKVVFYQDLRGTGEDKTSPPGTYDNAYEDTGIPVRALLTVVGVAPGGVAVMIVATPGGPVLKRGPRFKGWLRNWWPVRLLRPHGFKKEPTMSEDKKPEPETAS